MIEERILLAAPVGRTAALAETVLSDEGFLPHVCPDVDAVCREMERGAGAAVLLEEVLVGHSMDRLARTLEAQPAWSDLPVKVFVSDRTRLPPCFLQLERLAPHREVSVLERPVHRDALIGSLHSALRHRRRQYELRDLLEREQRMRTELEHSNRELEGFAHTLSHEIRSPLAAVHLNLALLSEQHGNLLDEATRRRVQRSQQSLREIGELADDLLTYARVGAGQEPRKRLVTDPAEVLEEVLAGFDPVIQERGAEVTHDELPRVEVHPGELRQLLRNLIGNGLKYNQRRPPRIHVSAHEEGDGWRFSVRDNGIGIAPADHERIFGLFVRTHAGRYPGSGVGLALCRRIVERHGGRIWVESKPGEGSTFHFTLPR